MLLYENLQLLSEIPAFKVRDLNSASEDLSGGDEFATLFKAPTRHSAALKTGILFIVMIPTVSSPEWNCAGNSASRSDPQRRSATMLN
jgi:hypothetical protein